VSNSIYTHLSWLAQPPDSFSLQCKALLEAESNCVGQRLRSLATFALNENQLNRLAKVAEGLRRSGAQLTPLTPFRLGILSNSTTDYIAPALVASALRYGISLECIRADYGQIVQEALSPDSTINAAKPDAVLIGIDYRALPIRSEIGDREAAHAAIEGAFDYLETIRRGIKEHSGAVCLVPTFAPAPEPIFGSFDRVLPGTCRYIIAALNRRLADSVWGTEDVLFDVASIAEGVGLADWHSPTQWNLARLPFSNTFLPLYADHLSRIVAALRGKSRRCLVLDLDNTVWGGVIGDDGLEEIQCAQGDATGEAFRSVQRLALDLRERGIVLAVSSKNNDDIARSPFRSHPEMLLKEHHIAVFQANWNDKATNIKAIAEELSLGLESIVLLDDNPAERGLVRQMLPEVGVPELPADPALYARTLSAAGYFESVAFSSEDSSRAAFYQDNARRVSLRKQAGNVEAYLVSLNMEITFQPFDAASRTRVTQLINKSNQFNLTTRRYTEAEIAEIESDSNCFTVQVRLADSFGDNGMISVAICRESSRSEWAIDTWLMSCRVLGRRVENMLLCEILEHARRNEIRKLTGIYRPTGRNTLVQDHYRKLGFTQTGSQPDGATAWELDVKSARVAGAPMTVKRLGFEVREEVSSR
jgi:FkbH-like protein